jgi:hypothetical protein
MGLNETDIVLPLRSYPHASEFSIVSVFPEAFRLEREKLLSAMHLSDSTPRVMPPPIWRDWDGKDPHRAKVLTRASVKL